MKTIKLLLLAIIMTTASCNDEDDPHPAVSELELEITNLIQPLIDDKITVGASVGIIEEGQNQMFFFGEKHIGGEVTDENTLYEIGSITKTMTATILAQLVLDQKIRIDDPVQNYLPQGATMPVLNGEAITLQHLANHTSSLPSIPDNFLNEEFDENDPFANYTEQMLLDFMSSYSLQVPIGSEMEYSNIAFGLLGYVLAQVEKKPVRNLFSDYIFSPLKMSGTLTEVPSEDPDLAQPHNGNLDPVIPWSFTEATFGAAGVLSTLPDMMKYLEANMGVNQTPLDGSIILTHTNTQTLNNPIGVGLAWVNYPHQTENETLTWHDGGTQGTIAFIGFVKERNLGVVLFFNTEIDERLEEELFAFQIGTKIIDLMKRY